VKREREREREREEKREKEKDLMGDLHVSFSLPRIPLPLD